MNHELFTVASDSEFDAHAHFSPSGLMYRELCARWEREQSGQSDFATEGTLMHKAVETRSTTGLDKEQAQSVQKCIDLSDHVMKLAHPAILLKEQRLLIGRHPDTGLYLTFGTADEVALAQTQRSVYINDWKMGRRSIPPADINLQGVCYAVGAFEEYSWADEVTVTFALPRRDEVTTHTFKRSDYPAMLLRIYLVVERTAKYLPPTFSSQSCEFCSNRIHCTEVKTNVFKVAAYYDNAVSPWKTAIDNVHSSKVTDPAIMSALLKVADVAIKWGESVKHHGAKLAIEQGVNIPDHELRTRTTSVREDDAAKVYSAVKHLIGTPEDFITACRVSKTKLDALVSDGAAHGKKKEARQQLVDALADAGLIHEGEKTSTYLSRIK